MKRSTFLAAAVALAATPAFAANDGTLSATSSTGTFDVYATVAMPSNPPGVKISGLTDLNFGSIPGNDVATSSTAQLCLYHSAPTATLTIRQRYSNEGYFRLTSNMNSAVYMPLRFTVSHPGSAARNWDINGGGSTGAVFNRQAQDCSTGSRTSISATVQPSNGTGAGLYAGYSGSFEMVITAE